MRLTGPSGGVVYHTRAARHADDLWRPFRTAISTWLDRWPTVDERLILIGPSAGYTLDDRFLARFRSILAIDPDPLAPALFRQRHRAVLEAGTTLTWSALDHFVSGSLDDLERLLAAHDQTSVLFSNFLGQLHLLYPEATCEERLERCRARFPELLSGRSWASYHDRLSGQLPLRFDQPDPQPKRLGDDALLDRYFAGRGGELVDHRTERLFPADLPHAYLHWELTPGQHHLIEAVHAAPGPSRSTAVLTAGAVGTE